MTGGKDANSVKIQEQYFTRKKEAFARKIDPGKKKDSDSLRH